ncbi:MAG: ADP-ribosylation factor-like protein [Candidatus Helarchaeota archaeon]
MKTKKISIVGLAGVGKTTLIRMLSDKQIPLEHNPTIALDFENICFNDCKISVWELGGQNQFQFMWEDFIKGSSLIFVVSDSTEQNVKETKKIVEHFKQCYPDIVVIANKQDQDGALDPTKIKDIIGVETIGMVAIDKSKKRILLKLLEQKIGME